MTSGLRLLRLLGRKLPQEVMPSQADRQRCPGLWQWASGWASARRELCSEGGDGAAWGALAHVSESQPFTCERWAGSTCLHGKGSLPHRPGQAMQGPWLLSSGGWRHHFLTSPLCLADPFLPPCSLPVSIGRPPNPDLAHSPWVHSSALPASPLPFTSGSQPGAH